MNHAIILAAGNGTRFAENKNENFTQKPINSAGKLFAEIGGFPLIYYTIIALADHPETDTITILANAKNKEKIENLVKEYSFTKVKSVILGGNSRQESVKKGVAQIEKTFGKSLKSADIIIVQNGANPFPSYSEISEVFARVTEEGACISGRPIFSTVKEISGERIIKTHDRKKLFAAETPQAAKYGIFKKALKNAEKTGLSATDESMLFEAIGQKVAYVQANENNFKITTFDDYRKIKALLGDTPEDFRVGIGQDSHMFDESEKGLTLGGLQLPSEQKLHANSDGDVILHAIFNAISQALGDMSLGFYADKQCEKGVVDSRKYIEIVLKKLKKEEYELNSLGVMIEGFKPKIDPLNKKLKESLSKILDLETKRIGITATSGEKCTVFGNGLGIQCFAIVSTRRLTHKKRLPKAKIKKQKPSSQISSKKRTK